MASAIYLSVFLMLGCACGGPVFKVTSNDNGGIPFYTIEQYDVVTKIRRQAWYELQLETKFGTDGAPHVVRVKYFLEQNKENEPCLEAMVGKFVSGRTASESYKSFETERAGTTCKGNVKISPPDVLNDASVDVLPLLAELHERKNRPKNELSYINVSGRQAGTASATIKLAPNGTLTEATGSVEDKTAEIAAGALTSLAGLVTSTVPINALLMKRWDLTKEEEKAALKSLTGSVPAPITVVETSLAVAQRSRMYLRAQKERDGQLIERRVIEVTAPADAKDTGKKVDFSGSVKLPE
jgi:hypothetical protein